VEDEIGGKVVRVERHWKEPTLVVQVRFYARANPSGQYPSTWTGTAQVDMYELATTSSSCWGFRCWWSSAEAAAWKAAEVVGFVDHAMARSLTVSYCLRQERPPAPATGGCSWISSGHVSRAQPEPENDCSFGACVVMPGKHPGRSPTSLNFTRQKYNTSRQWESRRLSCHVLGCSSVELRRSEFDVLWIYFVDQTRTVPRL
jgi:hypothetical protein